MSRNHHVHAHEVTHLVQEVNKMSIAEAEQAYGIQISEDGTVYDPTYVRTFVTVSEWAEFSFEQDEVDYSEDFGTGV
jgi:hypothetical protein